MSIELRFLMAVLATWRLASLCARHDGPARVLARLRRIARPGREDGVACAKCLGVWIAMPFAWFVCGDIAGWIVAWLALAGATALIEDWLPPAFEWREARRDELLPPQPDGRAD
ncbi:hypothetical protein AWB75_06205 [Caballeronia catudaia]|uniref:DUF1360 domain-containing protein n=1 Tax=Caballeronia catudaia TaxID=1777136 RepID=A0A158D511_9BURK|nr:hypothetical protein [Caballeronia catudaia]SAK89669.1 hypothetical protein AWB75_06205 [Caballeronia catudaia]